MTRLSHSAALGWAAEWSTPLILLSPDLTMLTTDLDAIFAVLTPEQKAMLTIETPAPAPTDPPQTSSYYDMDDAIPVTFKATLTASAKARDGTYAQRFDHIWCKGHHAVRGPKGGVYLVGRGVMGVKKHQQVKGTLRISNARFLDLKGGGTVDGWFRPDGTKDSVLIGELSAYKPL